MSYASKQLADELKKLSQAEGSDAYCHNQFQAVLSVAGVDIPKAVADFVREAEEYSLKTKEVSIGVY